MKGSLVQVRVDQQTKQDADSLFADLGMDTATAIRIFLRQAIQGQGLPFDVRLQPRYNSATEAAIEEGEAIATGQLSVPGFTSWSDFEATLDDNESIMS